MTEKSTLGSGLGALPADAAQRKATPIATGFIDYFPYAVVAVALLSKRGAEQHKLSGPLHWDRSKSTDEADALMRHFVQRGGFDTDGMRHSAKVAWRAMALLQKEIENSGPEQEPEVDMERAAKICEDESIMQPLNETEKNTARACARAIRDAAIYGEQEPDTKPDKYYLQDTRSTVGNAVFWWKKDGYGCTTDITQAEKFNVRGSSRPSDISWPVSYIDSIAKPTVDFQKLKHNYHGEVKK